MSPFGVHTVRILYSLCRYLEGVPNGAPEKVEPLFVEQFHRSSQPQSRSPASSSGSPAIQQRRPKADEIHDGALERVRVAQTDEDRIN